MRHSVPRRALVALAAVALLGAAAVRHPTIDLRVVTHDARDPAPARVQAAIEFGLLGVSILYTWTRRLG